MIPSIRKTGSYSLDTSDSITAVQVKDMFIQITEALQEIKSSCALDNEQKNKIERYCTKIGIIAKKNVPNVQRQYDVHATIVF